MRDVCWVFLLIPFATTASADAASPGASTFSYTASGTCLASPEGFNSKLEPLNSGVAWTTVFKSLGNADANGNATEVGQSVDTASFGVGPRMHMPAAHVYRDGFSFVIGTSDEKTGDTSLRAGALSGSFTAGPNTGVAFTVSGFELKKASGDSDLAVYASAGAPVIQTVSLANGIKFERVCVLTLSAHQ
jgi:hypothetical protein